MARILVTDARLGSAVSIIRSLGRRGHEVLAADSESLSAGFYSRDATERIRYPAPDHDPDGAVDALLATIRERSVDLVVPVTDDVILPLSRVRDRFEALCAVALPDPTSLAVARDKQATLELARSLGVPVPRTALVETVAEARREAATLGWPIVLKPQASRVYGRDTIDAFNVAYAGGFGRLEALMAPFEGRCSVLLQEYRRGEGLGVELLTLKGVPLAVFQHRRLREVPITGGASSFRESVPVDPSLLDLAVRMLAALDWTGLAMVEFKVGSGGPTLMEINGRVWGSLPLAVKSGVDFPALLADVHLGGGSNANGSHNGSYTTGVRSRNLELEVVWIASVLRGARRYPFLPVPPRRMALAAAARLFVPGDGYDILAADDPLPGLADILRIAGRLRRKIARGR